MRTVYLLKDPEAQVQRLLSCGRHENSGDSMCAAVWPMLHKSRKHSFPDVMCKGFRVCESFRGMEGDNKCSLYF